VEQGQVAALLGANGAGKSTTLRAISGLLKPSRGEIRFDGQLIGGVAAHKIAALGIAHVPEGRGIFADFTVLENLVIGAHGKRMSTPQFHDRCEWVLNLFPRLRERLKQTAGTLSGGEQQMLAMARALISKPRLLLLDEPSLGLAPQIVQVIFRIIREINTSGDRTTVLLVEQNVHMALQAAHHASVLEVGAIAMSGDAKELAASDEVRKAYLGVS
jgi:branched-chain amino acid transport system ATP-binding protein